MRIGLAQINPVIGDLEGNVGRCLAAVQQAQRQKADLVVLPEMALTGCPPLDILFDNSFVEAAGYAAADLAERLPDGLPVLVGSVVPAGCTTGLYHPGLYDAALLLCGGKVNLAAAKRLLRSDDVFFETRWFVPGSAGALFEVAGEQVGVMFGADLDDDGFDISPAAELKNNGAALLVCLSASPYRGGVMEKRLALARRAGLALVYVNLCGGNDELIYDGRSFVLDSDGRLVQQLAAFEEDVVVAGDEPLGEIDSGAAAQDTEVLYQALVCGTRDFLQKNGIGRAFLGLSGGVDSSLVAVIAADALGSSGVMGVAMPSRFTDRRSTESARELADSLGIGFEVLPLEGFHLAAEAALGKLLAVGTAAENVQARLRAVILMSYVNCYGGILLNTSNKTELALGYGTVGGDLAGTLCPIGDLGKPDVYRLARWLHAERGLIPDFTLSRPPSAELKPDQVDPFDYDVVSPQVEELVLSNRSTPMMQRTENKRRQLGIVLKVSEKSFGLGRLIPVSRR